MKLLARIFTIITAAAILTSCGGSSFKIEGDVNGVGTQNIRVLYFADGALQSIPASVVDGQFLIEGRSDGPTLVSLYLSDKSLLGRLVISDGETVKATFDKNNPYKVEFSGNKVSEEMAKFYADNSKVLSSGDHKAINKVVASYVRSHPTELLSTVLLITLYDTALNPTEALKLYNSIDPDARPAAIAEGYAELTAHVAEALKRQRVMPIRYYSKSDSMSTFRPSGSSRTLLAFSYAQGRDSVVKALRELARATDKRHLRILDISADADSLFWRRNIERDSATWTQGWIPAALMAQGVDVLAIPDMPYFIVIDSAGRQIERTPSVTAAVKAAR